MQRLKKDKTEQNRCEICLKPKWFLNASYVKYVALFHQVPHACSYIKHLWSTFD